MQFIITSSEIQNDPPINDLFNRFKNIAKDRPGCSYYKYPIAGGNNSNIPDIILADLEYGICLFNFCSYLTLDKIDEVEEENWIIDGKVEDSPLLQLEDYVTNLKFKYDKYRLLRGKVKINSYVVFPSITRNQFLNKTQGYEFVDHCLFADELNHNYDLFWKNKSFFEDSQTKKLFLSVTQGAGRLNDYKRLMEGVKADKIGEAIKLIDTKIAYLDNQQHAAAIQIPDGPQRIRGMAGTGKTIILTMKAAFLHSKYPDKKVLYTFHTQSLYNQIRDLITKFYRDLEDKDPNWNNLLVMHAWGGKAKEGVYSRACLRNSIEFHSFSQNTAFSDFGHVCSLALEKPINSEYDFILMDEAQDFPPSFYQLIYKLCFQPKRIIFAYDELQSLNKLSMPDTGDLFGYNIDGTKVVDFSKGTYDGGIEMDFVLFKSYRNPLKVLMTAHSIGLGIYNSDGTMQVIDDANVWNSIGYKVLQGSLKEPKEDIIIERPIENSESFANELYSGDKACLETFLFNKRDQEINWVASQIKKDIDEEKIEPHDIVVISISQSVIETLFIPLQKILFAKGIPSIIPGVGGVDRDQFGEKGFVTLSTVYKAKGNEAFVVYVMSFDYLYDYVNFVHARNTAFTSISRSKGWCRISGVGEGMVRAIKEIEDTVKNVPLFKFKFPDQKKIRRKLSQEETARRQQEKKKGNRALIDLLSVDEGAIDFESLSEEQISALRIKLGKLKL